MYACLLYSYCVVFLFFSGQLLVLLPCCPAQLSFLLHILNCFIELINDDDDDDDVAFCGLCMQTYIHQNKQNTVSASLQSRVELN